MKSKTEKLSKLVITADLDLSPLKEKLDILQGALDRIEQLEAHREQIKNQFKGDKQT